MFASRDLSGRSHIASEMGIGEEGSAAAAAAGGRGPEEEEGYEADWTVEEDLVPEIAESEPDPWKARKRGGAGTPSEVVLSCWPGRAPSKRARA